MPDQNYHIPTTQPSNLHTWIALKMGDVFEGWFHLDFIPTSNLIWGHNKKSIPVLPWLPFEHGPCKRSTQTSYRQPFAEVKSRKNHCWWQPFSKSSLRPQCHRCLTQSMCQTGTYWVFFGGKKHISGKWAARSLASRTGMWTDWACELRTHLTLDYTTAVWQSHCWADHIIKV